MLFVNLFLKNSYHQAWKIKEIIKLSNIHIIHQILNYVVLYFQDFLNKLFLHLIDQMRSLLF